MPGKSKRTEPERRTKLQRAADAAKLVANLVRLGYYLMRMLHE
jgi:hypothetical protein